MCAYEGVCGWECVSVSVEIRFDRGFAFIIMCNIIIHVFLMLISCYMYNVF